MSQTTAGTALKEIRYFLQELQSRNNLIAQQISIMSSLGDEKSAKKNQLDNIKKIEASAMSVVSQTKLEQLKELTQNSENAKKYLNRVEQFNKDYYINLEQSFKTAQSNLLQLEADFVKAEEEQLNFKTNAYPIALNAIADVQELINKNMNHLAHLAPTKQAAQLNWVELMDKLLAAQSVSSINIKKALEDRNGIMHFWRSNFSKTPASYKTLQKYITQISDQFGLTPEELSGFCEKYEQGLGAQAKQLIKEKAGLDLKSKVANQILSDAQMQMSILEKKIRELPRAIAQEKAELAQSSVSLEKYKTLSSQQRFERSFNTLMTQDFNRSAGNDAQVKPLIDFLLCLTQNEETKKQLIDFVSKKAAKEKITDVVGQSLVAQTNLLKSIGSFITSLKKSESKLNRMSSSARIKFDTNKIKASVNKILEQADKMHSSINKVKSSVQPAYESNFTNFTIPLGLGIASLASYDLISANANQMLSPQSFLIQEQKKRQSGDDGTGLSTSDSSVDVFDVFMITQLLSDMDTLTLDSIDLNQSMSEIESSVNSIDTVSDSPSPSSSCSSSSCSSCGGGGD